jgi:2-phosphoglycerate kinase
VLVGVRAVLDRAVEEGYSVAVEGVHLVPGLVEAPREGAVVCECLLTIHDEEEHSRHFWVRDSASEGARPVEKYLRALPEIRRIQDYLVERARRAGTPVVENTSRGRAVDAVVELVLGAAERAGARL